MAGRSEGKGKSEKNEDAEDEGKKHKFNKKHEVRVY
jgi:hypothetical protein